MEAEDVEGFEEEMEEEPEEIGTERKITSDGGVRKTLMVPGQGWQTPIQGNDVHVHYVGRLLDGTVFDSSRERGEPFKFTLGKGQVIKGWDAGVKTMKKGETCLLTCDPEYAYGEQGSPPKIPPNSTLQFEVELLFWGTDVTDGKHGVMKTITKEGNGYEQPKDLWEVTVSYEARVAGQDKPFSSSGEKGVTFVVQDGYFCPALSAAVKSMKLGESAKLEVSPEFGFGSEEHPDVPPNSALEICLDLVSWCKVESLSEDGGILKKVIASGEGYKKPSGGVKVKLTGSARLLDGTVMKEFPEGEELEFTTEEEEVLQALDKAVMQMSKGEKAEIIIKPPHTVSATGLTKTIDVPSGSTIVYELTLTEFESIKESWDMEEPEKLDAASNLKDRGNAFFKEGKHTVALKKYEKGLSYIEYDTSFSEENKAKSRNLKKSLYLNVAATKLKIGQDNECVQSCTKALELDGTLVKAYFRRSQAYENTKDYDLAEADLKKALELDQDNLDVQRRLTNLKRKIAQQNRKDAKLYGSIFQKMAKITAAEDARLSRAQAAAKDGEHKTPPDQNNENTMEPQEMEA